MTQVEEMEQEASDNGIHVDYINFNSDRINGLYIDGSIAIKTKMNSAKTADTLAEELEHHYTTVGNILYMDSVSNRKQEHTARLRAYNRRIGLSGIISAYRAHCQNRHEFAEHLGVTEEFLQDAIDCYREKYGICVNVDGYTIFFEPSLAVMESYWDTEKPY